MLAIGTALGAGDAGLVAAAALGGVAFLVAFGLPRTAVLVALALGMLQYGPTKTLHLVPSSFTVLDDILLLALGLRWLVDVAFGRTAPPAWVTMWLLVWMAIGLLSAVGHGISVMTTLDSYRWMFLPTVLYMVSAQYGRERGFARNVIRVVMAIGLLQAAVAIVQAVIARSIGDSSFGLLGQGGANALGFIILLAVVLLAAEGRSPSWSVWIIVGGIAGIVAASARAAIMAMPFTLILAYRDRLRRPAVVLALAAIVTVSGYTVVVAFETSHADLSRDMSLQRLVGAQLENPSGGGGRLLPLLHLPELFGASPVAWTTGLGPGQYGSAFRQIPSMLSFSYSVANSEWTVISGEYGLVGLLCFLAILIRPLRLSSTRWRARNSLPWMQQIERAAPSIVLIGVLGMTVLTILEYQPFSYPWWALLGLLEAASTGSALATSAVSENQSQNGVAGGSKREGRTASSAPRRCAKRGTLRRSPRKQDPCPEIRVRYNQQSRRKVLK